ncbi:MAG: acyl-CoA thioesterase [Anaerolineales bacterium]|nr:acyl-CoA thioesterase [Anaerolineales bacterium]
MPNNPEIPIYTYRFTIPESAVDENGHVNNVMYVQWMQDIAVKHYTFIGGTALIQELGCTWVVREHKIEYLLPAFADEEIEVQTWVADIRRVRSLRKYRFVRLVDEQTLVRGETDWVLVDIKTGHPHRIPPEAANIFRLKP